MRRTLGFEWLVLAFAMLFTAGCAGSSSSPPKEALDADLGDLEIEIPDFDDSFEPETGQPDIKQALPDAKGAADPATGKKVGDSDVEVPPGADSDLPGGYPSPDAAKTNDAPHVHANEAKTDGTGEDAAKANGRAVDGDDPKAQVIVPQAAKEQDEAPLNDGRAPSAKPVPEGARVAAETDEQPAESLNAGRAKDAKPGAEIARPNPAKATPTTKPAPRRATLADLSESIQELDNDSDGQLGLYEWPREKLAEFKTLDTNEDGFVTAAELVAGQQKPTDQKPAAKDKPDAASKEKEAKAAAPKTGDAKTASDPPAADDAKKDAAKKDDAKTDDAKKDDGKTDSAKTESADPDVKDDQPEQGS